MAYKGKKTTTKSKPKGKDKGKKRGEFKPYPNSIAVFKNDNTSNEKAPSYRGRITLGEKLLEAIRESDGETFDMEVSLWNKKSEAGNRYLSGLIQLPYEDREDGEEEGEEEEEESKEDDDDF